MNLKAVLFDLDGTLLPMDQDEFVKAYFGLLAEYMVPYGYKPKELIGAVWAGTKAMILNNGEATNETAFWRTFCEIFGLRAADDEPLFARFYAEKFDRVRTVCGYNAQAAGIVHRIKELGLRVSLATNPIFPAIATESRIRWAGLQPEDFEGYTTYENCCYCKPDLNYYRDILDKLQLQPEQCLMVGNDVGDDMVAKTLGMNVFLLTDCLINKEEKPLDQYPHGGFETLRTYVEENCAP